MHSVPLRDRLRFPPSLVGIKPNFSSRAMCPAFFFLMHAAEQARINQLKPMNETLKLLKSLLNQAGLTSCAEIQTYGNGVAAQCQHPKTGATTRFVLTKTKTREHHSLANLLSRMRRFQRLGQDLAGGQAYYGGAQASNQPTKQLAA